MPTDVLIVRHGQSTWNALGRWQGHADPPLSEHGRVQALAARRALDGAFDAAYASDLRRARETAELAIGHLHDVVTDPALRERAAGEWEGLTRADLDERWPGWQETGWRPDGFETDVDVLARVLPALDRLAVRHGPGRLFVVTHGGVVRALDRRLGAEPVAIANLCGRWYHRRDDEWLAGEYVELATEVTDSVVE